MLKYVSFLIRITLTILCLSTSCFAQNLIPNPSFEVHSICPDQLDELYQVSGWYKPSIGTSDAFSDCGQAWPGEVSVPENISGFQHARTGNSYLGFIAASFDSPATNYREYAQVKLKDTLKENHYYIVSYYISLADNSNYGVNKIGVALSDTSFFYQIDHNLPLSPSSETNPSLIYTDSTKWTEVRDTILATGTERYLTIGCFQPDSNLSKIATTGTFPYSYYYVDDISLAFHCAKANLDFGYDLFPCDGDSIVLNAMDYYNGDTNITSLQWSNGSTDPTITIKEQGDIWLDIETNCGKTSDTIYIDFLPHPNLRDTLICDADEYIIDLTRPNTSFTWNDGSKSPVKVIDSPGIYFVYTYTNGCTIVDSIEVEFNEAPLVNLGPDTLMVCLQDKLSLDAKPLNEASHTLSYLWQGDGTNEQTLEVDTGMYFVRVTNPCGVAFDTLFVKRELCNCKDITPNSFSPNGDGLNDQFKVFFPCQPEVFNLRIYNRWGEQLYFSSDPNQTWDGKHENQLCKPDLYLYKLNYQTQGQSINKTGKIYLIP